MGARWALIAAVVLASAAAYAGSGFGKFKHPEDPNNSDIELALTARLPMVRATIHAPVSTGTPVMLHVNNGGSVNAASVWPIGEGDAPLAIAFVVDERIRGDTGAAFDRFLPLHVPPGSQLTIVSFGQSATIVAPLQPIENVHGEAFGKNVVATGAAPRDLKLAIRTAVHQLRVPGAIRRVIVIDAGNLDLPNWHEGPDDADIEVDFPPSDVDPLPALTHELTFLDPTVADFDVVQLDVFDGKPHTYWVTMGELSTQAVTLAFTRDGRLIPPTRQQTSGSPSTPSWLIALLGLAQLLMLVIAYRVALRDPPPAKPER